MAAPAPDPLEPPPWEYLLAHHGPGRYDRTLRLPFGRRRVHLCARCTGQGLGVVAFLVGAAVLIAGGRPLFEPSFQLLIALAPLPAAIDWLSQSMGRRESTTSVRVVTGMLLGFAFADLVALPIVRPWWWFAIGIGIFALYAIALLSALLASGAWRAVLREHFPEAVVPPGPAVRGP